MRKKTIYNNISVTLKNENTNNHCINVNQLLNGKNFNFKIDGENYILTPKQVMDYIEQNPSSHKFKRHMVFDEVLNDYRTSVGHFYLISDNYIINNAA